MHEHSMQTEIAVPRAAAIHPALPQAMPSIDVEALFLQHRRHVLRFVSRYVHNADDAEDVVQLTYLEALRNRASYSGRSKPSTWLFGIAVNVARHYRRSSYALRTDHFEEVPLDEIGDHVLPPPDPADIVSRKQVAERVMDVMDALPANLKDTVEQVLDRGCTYVAAAEALDVPVGTIRSRMSRVRELLRAHCGSLDCVPQGA